jgi:hypothetical protein
MIEPALSSVPLAVQPQDFYRHIGNVFVKRMYLAERGQSCIGHAHKHAHLTLLAHGSVLIKSSGIDLTFYAPAFIDIGAGEHHQFVALTDETLLYCIHDTKGLDPDDLGEPFIEKAG